MIKRLDKKALLVAACAFAGIILLLCIINVIIGKVSQGEKTPLKPEQNNTTSSNETDVAENTTKEENKTEQENKAEEYGSEQQGDPTPETPSGDIGNCTVSWGPLILINYNFNVDEEYIWARRGQLIDISEVYGIEEGNYYNGAPLMDSEAAAHLYDMYLAYLEAFPGHTLVTNSCFRAYGTSCGRLCAATGTSEHHSGYACDLIDPAYTNLLSTDLLDEHLEWQWLKENSYKYGFIDRYPVEWAGGSMDEPLNVNTLGTTGYYETWHYRYVGLAAAKEIATGVYNSGAYDSLEHYLLMKGYVADLLDETSCR